MHFLIILLSEGKESWKFRKLFAVIFAEYFWFFLELFCIINLE